MFWGWGWKVEDKKARWERKSMRSSNTREANSVQNKGQHDDMVIWWLNLVRQSYNRNINSMVTSSTAGIGLHHYCEQTSAIDKRLTEHLPMHSTFFFLYIVFVSPVIANKDLHSLRSLHLSPALSPGLTGTHSLSLLNAKLSWLA